MAAPTCCIDTSKSRSGSAESAVHRVLLAASKHKRNSGSDETKRKTCEEKTRLVGKPGKEIKYLIEIPLELVSTQVLAVTLSPAPGSAACDATGDED
jgi:hypothetical protein